jgi:hypothetical protein
MLIFLTFDNSGTIEEVFKRSILGFEAVNSRHNAPKGRSRYSPNRCESHHEIGEEIFPHFISIIIIDAEERADGIAVE